MASSILVVLRIQRGRSLWGEDQTTERHFASININGKGETIFML
jgi:hypothetical protein